MPSCAKGVRDDIRALQQDLGLTAVYVTHYQEEALAISDQLAVMNQGRIDQIGTRATFITGRRPRSSPTSARLPDTGAATAVRPNPRW